MAFAPDAPHVAPMIDFLVYAGLAGTAFLAATVVPWQSEVALVALILSEDYALFWLIAAASFGNTLGAVVNWYLGGFVDRFVDRKWFPASRAQMDRASGWYHKYGRWSLLMSWAPFGGDTLTVVAGVLREPLPSFLIIVGLAKTARYIVVAAITLQWV
jgi:membrane protein YqaA with SNARE-associated domain